MKYITMTIPGTTSSKKKGKRPFRHRFATALQVIAGRQQKRPFPDKKLESIVILAKERYGDCIMLTPLIGALRREFPDMSIYLVAFNRAIYEFFRDDTNITAVYQAKKNTFRYVSKVLLRKFDLLFNPKDHPSTHFLIHSVLIPARFKVSHSNPFHQDLFDKLISLKPETHESVKNLSLLDVIKPDLPVDTLKPYLPPMPVSGDTAEFLKSLPQGEYIGINISAGHSGGHRTPAQWSEFIRMFPAQRFIIFSSPQDLGEKRELEQQHPNVRESPGTQNLYEVGEMVKKLRMLISPDTSLVHVASCFDTPLIGLYRASVADRTQFGPLSTLKEVIVSPTADVTDIETATIAASFSNLLATLS